MCFYHDMRVTLTHNPTAWIDAHGFGDSFDASMDALKAWDTVRAGAQLSGLASRSRSTLPYKQRTPCLQHPQLPGDCFSLQLSPQLVWWSCDGPAVIALL